MVKMLWLATTKQEQVVRRWRRMTRGWELDVGRVHVLQELRQVGVGNDLDFVA